MDSIEEFISSFNRLKWKSEPNQKLIRMIDEDRASLKRLATGIVREIPDGGTFLDDLLSHLTESEFHDVVVSTLEAMDRNGVCRGAESVLEYASMQFPRMLRPHLRHMFKLRVCWKSYLGLCAWRVADEQEIEELKKIVATSGDQEERDAALTALLETGEPGAIVYAQRYCDDVDYVLLRRRTSGVCHHLVFRDQENIHLDGEVGEIRKRHPSWKISGTPAGEGVVGGRLDSACNICGEGIHALLRIKRPSSFPPPFEAGFTLGACLSCLGWEASPLYYFHEADGRITCLNSNIGRRTPEFPAEPWEALEVSLVPTPERWQFQDWACSNSRENLHRIGGMPCWIQYPKFPTCVRCAAQMRFLMQLDSDLPNVSGDRWLWGSGGIGYFFWCAPCRISAALWQCT